MSNVLCDVLNYVNEGIVILNDNLEIIFWNRFMEELTGKDRKKVINTKVFHAIPGLNKDYYKKAFYTALKKDFKYFFSSEIHKNIISNDLELNIRVQKFNNQDVSYLVVEFIDVTSQHIRIDQLKGYVNKLYLLNKELKDKEKQIERLAYYDKLTNLANRTLFYQMAEKLLANSKRQKSILGLMFIDIDGFKNINDTYGHLIGDKVLIEVSNILEDSVRENDIVARHGGDEFLILLPDLSDYNNYKNISRRIAKANKKVRINNELEISICLSIGVSFYPKDGITIDELISKADKAMYKVKSIGGDKFTHYMED